MKAAGERPLGYEKDYGYDKCRKKKGKGIWEDGGTADCDSNVVFCLRSV